MLINSGIILLFLTIPLSPILCFGSVESLAGATRRP
jgi:hypothetical protein